MKNRFLLFVFLPATVSVLFLFTSCRQKNREVITRRIQYDVNIKSPHPDYDWWIQNLPGPQREHLVQTILQGAESGRYKAYDYFYQPLSRQAVAHILADTIALRVRRTVPPYDMKDTLIVTRIGIKDILRLRFMEKWSMDPKTLHFQKTILGIAPVARRTDAKGHIRWQPLFWIFPDKATAKMLQQTR
jgi:hypothetical protein